jgi:alpha-mannosidase
MFAGLAQGQISAAADANKSTLWYVPHTHWEGAVFKTREEYLDIGLPIILCALNTLKRQPGYKFTLDQAALVKPFLDRYPEEEANFKKFVSEGAFQLVADEYASRHQYARGESFIRQVMIGKNSFRNALAWTSKRAGRWTHSGITHKMPQILKLAGMNSYWFFRGVANLQVPSEFQWQGIDGTRSMRFGRSWSCRWLRFALQSSRIRSLLPPGVRGSEPFARGNDLVSLAGADVSEPEEHFMALMEQFNRRPMCHFRLRIGLPRSLKLGRKT